MTNKNLIEINAIIQKKNALTGIDKPIGVRVFCKFQYAIAIFTDKKLAKKLAAKEKSCGKKVTFDDKTGAMIEYFPTKTAKEIAQIIGEQMKKAGGKLV